MRPLIALLSILVVAGVSVRADAQALPTWNVLPKPVFDVTGLAPDGKVLFEHPVAALRTANGTVLVADAGPSSIRVFDATGRLVRTVGRAGRGPGEFPFIGTAVVCGDSMLVWDPSRTSLVGPTGEIARPAAMLPSPMLSCSADGSVAYASAPAYVPTKARDVFTTRSVVSWVDLAGRAVWQSDSVLEGERVNAHPGGYRRPLGTALFMAFVGPRLAIAPSDSARVWLFTRDGKREIVRLPSSQRRAPTEREYVADVKRIVERAPAVALRANTEKNLLRLERPSALPSFYGIWGDSEGCLWIRLSPPGRSTTELLVLKPGQGAIARVVVNRDIEIQEIGRDHMTVLFDDADDERHVAVLTLIRR